MNADNDRQIRAWLEARDPGEAPAHLRAALAEVPYARRSWRLPGLDFVRLRLFGVSLVVRPLVVLLVVLALVAAIVGAGQLWTWLQFPPRGLIAYTALLEQTGSTGIRLIAADGTGARQITAPTPNLLEHVPRWSPDGRTLAFARIAELDAFSSCLGVGSVVLYDVATETERTLVTGIRGLQEIAWSPSGNQLAYVEPTAGCFEDGDLGVIDVASGSVTHSPLSNGVWRLRWTGESVSAVSFSPVAGLPGTVDPPPVQAFITDALSLDGRFIATVDGPGRVLSKTLEVKEQATGTKVELGAGGAPAWAPDDAFVAFVQFTAGPSEYGLNFRDRLVIATAGTWQIRALADVMIGDVPGSPGQVRLPPLSWTRDGRAIYWMDMTGGHVVEIATGRVVDLPAAVNGCDDLQWQPMPGAG